MQVRRSANIARRMLEVPPDLKKVVEQLVAVPDEDLPDRLAPLSLSWDRPRGDLCHWVPLLNRFDGLLKGWVAKYELEKENVDPLLMDPIDEHIAISVLNFSAFLLENCSNRGIYPSIKRVSPFLHCVSPYIVSAALSVCVKLANRFAQSRSGKSSITAVDPELIFRLATFLPTSQWERADKAEVSLENFIDPNYHWGPDWNTLTLQFFFKGQPKSGSFSSVRSSNTANVQNTPERTPTRTGRTREEQPLAASSSLFSQEGLNTLTIGSQEVLGTPICDLIKRVYAIIPKDFRINALNKIRVVKACTNTEEGYRLRLELCKIQLLAFGFAVCSFSESTVESRILAKRPNFLRQLGALVSVEASTPPDLAILALETLQYACHQAARRTEVLSALSANVSHGILMSIIRVFIRDLKASAPINEEFAVNIFIVTLQIASTQALGNMLVSAGIVPLLIEIIQIPSLAYRVLSSVMELLDYMIIGSSTTFGVFSQAGGVATLIDVIKAQTEGALQDPPSSTKYAKVDYTLSFHRSQWIRSLFVAVSNILVNSSTSESIHSLVDSPLLHCIKFIIANPTIFGSRILSLNFQILCSMLENEPSSFGVMYEGKLIDSVVDMFPKLLEVSNSYMSSIIKFVGAMAHNESGLALVQDRDLLKKVLDSFSSDLLQSESLASIGNILDGLITEHANLRGPVVTECIKFLEAIPAAIESMSNPQDFYLDSEIPFADADKQNPPPKSDAMSALEHVTKFLEGLLKNHLTRAEFIEQKGFTDLINLFAVIWVPYDFAFSSIGYSLGNLARTLFTLDIHSSYIEQALLDLVTRQASQLSDLVVGRDWRVGVISDPSVLDAAMRSLSSLSGSLQVFFQVVFFEIGTGYRVLDVFNRVVKTKLIQMLAELQRWSMWQEALTLDGLSSELIEATKPLSVDVNRTESEEYRAAKEAEGKLKDIDPGHFRNVKILRFLNNATSVMISKIFAEFASYCTNERSMNTQKKNGLRMAALIGEAMVEHLKFLPFGELDIATGSQLQVLLRVLISFLATLQKIMLKPWSGTSAMHLGVFVMFKQGGGIERLLELFHTLWKRSITPGSKEEPLLVFSLKVILIFIGFTVSYRSVLENNRAVSPLASRETEHSEPYYFNPNQFFIECRIILVHNLIEAWDINELLGSLHPQAIKLLLDILTKLFTFTGEDGASKLPRELLPRVLSWTQIVPSEPKLVALTKLGFDEDMASQTLIEQRDDIEAALHQCLSLSHRSPDDVPELSTVYVPPETRFMVGPAPVSTESGARLVLASDLNDLRERLKHDLLDGLLELIQTSPDTVYATSGLISKMHSVVGGARTEKQKAALATAHKEIYISIMTRIESFSLDSDSDDAKKLAACLHLLGLLMQEQPFFQNCFPIVVDNFGNFVDMISVEDAQSKEYYPSCLLIIEKILTNSDIPFYVPRNFTANFPDMFPDMFNTIVPRLPEEQRDRLFKLLCVPKKFSNDLSVLAVARICVHFAKDRSLAQELLRSGMVIHLLLSVKEFSNSVNLEKLETAVLIILRYCVETPEMVKQSMKNEITAWFAVSKMADAVVFVKSHYMLVARSPEIFVDVVSELCCFHDASLNTANICLKEHLEKRRKKTLKLPEDDDDEEVEEKKSKSKKREQKMEDTQMSDVIKVSDSDSQTEYNKLFNPEHSSGIIQLLLSQLFSLKREDIFMKPEKDERLIDFEALKESVNDKDSYGPKFVYCYFLLSALAELLASYTQCKLEFIHFTKKSPFPSTPGKFRAYPLHYLLQELIPVPTMSVPIVSAATQEWMAISGLATTVIVSLMAATDELGKDISKDKVQNFPALIFVRKLTLDALSKSLRDVLSNNETLDWKYSALGNISDLCYRLLSNRSSTSAPAGGDLFADGASIAKIMYDKKFVSLFTSYLGELDLNYPQSKKVIKIAIRFLNKLSRLTLEISEDLTNPTQEDGEDDELEDESFYFRDETPDLFRNSTLGMFEVDEDYNEGDLEGEEESVEHSSDEDRMEYDEVNDEALSDVGDDESEGADSIEFDDDDEDSDISDDEDGDMGDEDMEDDNDMDIGDSDELNDESSWESYDDEEEDIDVPGEDEVNVVTALQELSGRAPRQNNIVRDEDGDDVVYSTRHVAAGDANRGYISEEDEEEEEEEDEESLDWDYSEESDSYFEFSNAFSRISDIRIDRTINNAGNHAHGDVVHNPLLTQPRGIGVNSPSTPVQNGSLGGVSRWIRYDAGRRNRDFWTEIFSQFAGVLGFGDARVEIEGGANDADYHVIESILRHHSRLHRRPEDKFHSIQKFTISTTNARWQEAAMMFSVFNRTDILGRILNPIYNRIVVYSLDEAQKADELEKEIKRREKAKREKEKERKRKQEEERKRQEEEERHRQEEEEQRRIEAATTASENSSGQAMDIDQAAESTSNEPRVMVSIGGREVDITGLGIDPTFLEALPADIREEAFTQHLREMRASGEPSRDLDPAFLEALPEHIRNELVDHEAQDGEGGPHDMELANFLATLDPPLRQTLLLEQGELALNSLPPEYAEEARELRSRTVANFGEVWPRAEEGESDGRPRRIRMLSRAPGLSSFVASSNARRPVYGYETSDEDVDVEEEEEAEAGAEDKEKKLSGNVIAAASLHLLDRSGAAALIRLLYLPQGVSQRDSLHELLLNLCSNKQSRSDVLHILLSVIQEGSADRPALEKGFVHTSHKARNGGVGANPQPKQQQQLTTPRTPNYPKGSQSSYILNDEVSPVVVTQQLLEALEYLVRYSGSVKYFFLCEHEMPVVKRKSKGKERDQREKYPINLLLNLLDRPVVQENNLTLELLSSLIQEITRPLPIVLKSSEKGSAQKEKKDESSSKAQTAEAESSRTEGATETAEHEEGTAIEGSPSRRLHRLIDPPKIPESLLQKVSNALTARECSSRTFQQTLALMHNLCAIPGVKELFGNELLRQAVSVGPIIIGDLKELLKNVRSARRGSDLLGASLAKFSSGSSDQAKLLRVLTAIDYLFDPSRNKTDNEDGKGTSYLESLYNQMTFGPLWGALSDCLRLLQDRPDMIHVATALLPLIEALMVVCKHSKIKDVQQRDTGKYEAKKYDIASEPLHSLFFSFTDEHRKILNQMVRNNPKLMSGSFSILVKNPKSLDFDNKRRFFYKRIAPSPGHVGGSISINVRRDQVFLDSYRALYFKSAEEIKNSKLNIRFQEEEGVDAGGVSREWYQVLSRQMFNPDYALFTPVASDRTTFHPNRTSWVNPEHLSFFKFIGRIIGKAIFDYKLLDCHFSRAVYKKILGKAVSIKDMETLDLDYYKSLVWMLENDITDIITETLSIEAEDYGEQKIIDLKPGGRDIPVTEENKQEYVQLVVDYRLLKSVQDQMEHFLQGFHDIISKDVVAIFDEQELELLISGMPDIDLDDWRNNTEYHNYTASSQQIKWFWRAVRSFDAEERAKLLQFATGTSKVPLNGFEHLEGMNGIARFNIHRDYGSKDRLPSSHTCFNQIDLPEYDSYETLRGALLTAITEGHEGFGFA